MKHAQPAGSRTIKVDWKQNEITSISIPGYEKLRQRKLSEKQNTMPVKIICLKKSDRLGDYQQRN